MYILFTTFFLSLLGIIIMIGRKLVLAGEHHHAEIEGPHPLVVDIQKIKEATQKHGKKYGYMVLVSVIRLHVKSSNFLKQRYEATKDTIKNMHRDQGEKEGLIKQEVSSFLRLMSDYKHKLRSIKHKIKKEEEIRQ